MKQTKQQAKRADEFAKWLEEHLPHISMKDKTEYRNVKTAISFICAEHGEYVARPDSVKKAKHGCRLCGDKSRHFPFEEFVKSAVSIHGDKYHYDKNTWDGLNNKIKILCKQCGGYFEQRGDTHLQGCGCPQCRNKSLQLSFEDFVEKAISIHGNRYEYDENSWNGGRNKTKIFCTVCNDCFEQIGKNHLHGNGCPVCNVGSGYSSDNEANFARKPELANESCKLYYILINNSYKIGITKKTLAHRYSGQEFKTLLIRETTRLFAWRAEQMILSEFAEYKQKGDIGNGSTECFGIDISTLENFHEIFNHNFTEPIQ